MAIILHCKVFICYRSSILCHLFSFRYLPTLNKPFTAMGKFILVLFLILLGVAFFTKPDDKTCIIGGVKAVWGTLMPDPNAAPDLFEQFMNLNSQNVEVKDWVIFKQIIYKSHIETKTVALGAFNKIFPRVKPVEHKPYIPKMPSPKQR
jgi:hypothetical protein